MKILFIGSHNQWQSKTAAEVFKYRNGISAKAANVKTTSSNFGKQIDWAELIFVLDEQARLELDENIDDNKMVVNLNIPNKYDYMHPELVSLLKATVSEYLS